MKPWDDIASFEAVRALAQQSPSAAADQIALQSHASVNTIVRIYVGPPGTGKTLLAVREAVRLSDPSFAGADSFSDCFVRMNELHEQIAFITFHPSLQYEDAVESIRPVLVGSPIGHDDDDPDGSDVGSGLRYEHYEGPIMRLAMSATRDPSRNYVLVVDEINRGDVSRILGPILSAIEADKRIGGSYPIGFERQYPEGGEGTSRFFLPGNLHVLGTMNSADRNLALVDYALRRRFEFVACPPVANLLANTDGASPINVRSLLRTINRRVRHLLDRDHEVGHGYFMSSRTNEEVVAVMAQKVVPLLLEYFYGDEGLVALVLADRVDGPTNVLRVTSDTASTEEIFGISLEDAHDYGLQASRSSVSVEIDPRFWNGERVPPGPDDLEYAVAALRKVYASESSAGVSGSTQPTTDAHGQDQSEDPDA